MATRCTWVAGSMARAGLCMARACMAVHPLAAPQLASFGSLGHFAAAPRSIVNAVARLVARPPASPSSLVSFAPLRALSTSTAPIVPATAASAVIAPKCAADLLVLGVLGVVDFVQKEAHAVGGALP